MKSKIGATCRCCGKSSWRWISDDDVRLKQFPKVCFFELTSLVSCEHHQCHYWRWWPSRALTVFNDITEINNFSLPPPLEMPEIPIVIGATYGDADLEDDGITCVVELLTGRALLGKSVENTTQLTSGESCVLQHILQNHRRPWKAASNLNQETSIMTI